MPGGIGAESKAALARIADIVTDAGFDLKDIVSVTVYLADIHDFPDMNMAYKAVMPDPKPARATVQVAGLVNNARMEISAIAVKTKITRWPVNRYDSLMVLAADSGTRVCLLDCGRRRPTELQEAEITPRANRFSRPHARLATGSTGEVESVARTSRVGAKFNA